MSQKIDVVYTWVDHEHKEWQKEKDKHIKKKVLQTIQHVLTLA